MKSDFNAKAILHNSKIMAAILKSVLKEYEDVSVEEISENYLTTVGDKIELLNTEQVNLGEIPTRYDLMFVAKTPEKFGYNLIIDVEVQTTDQGLAFIIRKINYMGKLFSRQKYKLDELKEQAKEEGKRNVDLYRNMDHPVLLSLEFVKKQGRGNKIIHTELQPRIFEYSDGLLGKIEKIDELKALPSEERGFGLEEFITLYIDEEDEEPEGVFKFLTKGALNSTRPVEDRIETIEEFTGPLGKGEIKMLEEEWGTAEYFEKRGEKRERENVIKKTVNILKKIGMSDEEIQQHLKDEELVTD